MKPRTIAILLFILYLLLYIAPLSIRPMIMPDEPRYAEIPREMLASGKWLSPTFNGMPYFEKPSAAYWPAMVSMKYLGENPFAARLPYALATGLSALLVFLLARRMRRDDAVFPLLATAVFLTTAEVFGIGTFAVLDSLFALFLTGTMLSFHCAWTETSILKRQLFMLLAGLCVGAAFMVKGFLALLLPGAAIAFFLLWMRDWRAFLTLPWAALAGFLALALPWALAQHSAEPDFWMYFILVEHLGRFTGDGAERHPQPFWFYIPVLLGGLLPFTVFAYSIVKGGLKLDWRASANRFLAAWIIIPFIILSISSGKLGTYILPLFPALTLLAVFCLFQASISIRSIAIACAVTFAFGVAWPFSGPFLDKIKSAEHFIGRQGIGKEMKVFATADMAGSVSWGLRRTDIEIFRKPGEFSFGLAKSKRTMLSAEDLKMVMEAVPTESGLAIFMPLRLYKKAFADVKAPEGWELLESDSGIFCCLKLKHRK
jgi:4-amino-4-deoxy-L-arabinose transferase-like glycosyltransferase